ncbi:MAG: thioredoxin family protein [Planctomycetota bacterium]|jgi:thioredoxin-related protein
MRTTLLTLALSAVACGPALALGDNWYADYDEAMAAAKEQQKDLLVDFTGSDWCGWCIKLDEEVFSTDAFLGGVADQYILVKLDFPRAEEIKAKVPNPERNRELQEQFGVRGFPTIALVNQNGERFAETGYRAGGPEPYLEHLTEIATSGKRTLAEMSDLVAKYTAAEGAEREALLGQLIDLAEAQDGRSPFLADLMNHAKDALTLETESGRALKLRAIEMMLDSGSTDADLVAAVAELDPTNAKGMRERLLLNEMRALQSAEAAGAWVDRAIAMLTEIELQDVDIKRDLYINIAYMADRYSENAAAAARYAGLALELGGIDNERTVEMLQGIAEQIEVETGS